MSRKKIKLIISLAIPVFILTGICVWLSGDKKDNLVVKSPAVTEVSIPFDYNAALFYGAISKYPALDKEDNEIAGMIVPHHDLAADYTAEIFQKLGGRKIKTVIVVGPNHTNGGAGDVITGLVAYTGLNGQVHTDSNLVNQLLKDNQAVLDSNRLSTEHSIYNVVPYIKYYFPEAKIVPLIVSGKLTKSETEKLGYYLANYINEETLIISSVDFSHYLTTEQANNNDGITRTALINRDYSKIYSLNNDYLDSPAAIITILTAMDKVKAAQTKIVRSANLAEATGVSTILSSTSYFTILFSR
jgi:hypothetical protein